MALGHASRFPKDPFDNSPAAPARRLYRQPGVTLKPCPLPTTAVESAIARQGFAWIPIQPAHAQALFALPALHRDPFDLLLIAQAKAEGVRIVTYDLIFAEYLPDTIISDRR